MMIRDNNTTRGASEHHNRVVWLSRLLWDNVVPWLVVSPTNNGDGDDDPTITSEESATLLSVGEGIFPLVPRMCRLVLSHDNKYYNALEAAAEAGAQSCLNWLITNHANDQAGNRRNETKEFIRVLGGLCRAGHLDAATRLTEAYRGGGGIWPSGITWGGGCGANGSGEAYIVEHVRMADILSGVCKRGHLDVVKWMVERFGYTHHPLELYGPVAAALSKGRLEVAKWIVGSIADPQSMTTCYSEVVQGKACKSGNVEAVKWVLGLFPLDSLYTAGSFYGYIRKNCTAVCECIKEHTQLPFEPFHIDSLSNAEVLRWASSVYSPFSAMITSETVQKVCPKEGGLDLLKWAVEENLVTPTPQLFSAACKNQKENLEMMKWLSTNVSLSPEDACECFAVSLASNNVATASWLDESFGIMKHATPFHHGATSILERVCKHIPFKQERIEGVKWLLNHPEMTQVEESLIVKAVRHLLFLNLSATPLLIIQKFPLISEPTRTELLVGILKESFLSGTFTQVKKVSSMGEFTKEAVAQCLANSAFIMSAPTRAVKWLITHFQLEREHITLDNNTLLHNLLTNKQASCAEWLINRFHITLDEVLELDWESSEFSKIDLFTFQMMLRVFPGITSGTVKQHWMCLATRTPVVAQFTMRVFPDITTPEIAAFWAQRDPWVARAYGWRPRSLW